MGEKNEGPKSQSVSQSVRQQTLTEHGLCARHRSRWWTVRDPKVSLSAEHCFSEELGSHLQAKAEGSPGAGGRTGPELRCGRPGWRVTQALPSLPIAWVWFV